ncbi:MAG: DUF2442 domain-containing protein [Chloroflexi bacterium]|nr:DUF2442 domain-containing protein [Chloroflexota bacterium]
MPTALRVQGYRFYFFASDGPEPAHVHVERESKRAKFWLNPVSLANNNGFTDVELWHIRRIVEEHRSVLFYWRHGMATSIVQIEVPDAQNVEVTEDRLTVALRDGRTITVPLIWYPRLVQRTPKERANWRFIARGEGIHWEDLDEDISVEGLLAGRPSMESHESLKRWLKAREERPRLRAEDFRKALRTKLSEASEKGTPFLDVNSGALHRELGGYPGPHHQMPTCCNVMRQEMRDGDLIVEEPPKGRGANLTIRYKLPRQ